MNIILPNPYKGLDQKDWRQTYRCNAFVGREDYELIRLVCPLHGTVQSIVATAVSIIANELRRNNTTDYDPNALVSILGRLTVDNAPRTGC